MRRLGAVGASGCRLAGPIEPTPHAGAYAWLSALETPVRRRPTVPRLLLETLFLAAAAAAARVAELDARGDCSGDGRSVGARGADRVGCVARRPASRRDRAAACRRLRPSPCRPTRRGSCLRSSTPCSRRRQSRRPRSQSCRRRRSTTPPRTRLATGPDTPRGIAARSRRGAVRCRPVVFRDVLFPTATFAIFFLIVLPLSWLTMPGRTAGGRSSSSRATSSTAGGTGASSSCSPAARSGTSVLAVRIHRARVAVPAEGAALARARREPRRARLLQVLRLLRQLERQPAVGRRPRRCRSALRSIVLPVGISFYTFKAISYVVDIYRGELRADDAREVRRLPLVLPAPGRRADRPARPS